MNSRQYMHQWGLNEGRRPDTGRAVYVPRDSYSRPTPAELAGEAADDKRRAAAQASRPRVQPPVTTADFATKREDRPTS